MLLRTRIEKILFMCLSFVFASVALGGEFPGASKLVVTNAPAGGETGEMVYYFKSKTNIKNLQVAFILPQGCLPLEKSLTKKIGVVPAGKTVKIPCKFKCEEMGIFRVGVKATAYATVLLGGTSKKYVFFEAGENRGFSPVIKPGNRWQKSIDNQPKEDEFVEVADNVYRSNTRVTTTKGSYLVDRYPVLPSVGNLNTKLELTAPPLLDRPVRLKYNLTVEQRMKRRNAPVEIVFLFPPNAFRNLNINWPEGGDYELTEDGFSWKGNLPPSKQLNVTTDIQALTPGEGKIRVLARVQGRGEQLTKEVSLLLRVNKRSAQIVGKSAE